MNGLGLGLRIKTGIIDNLGRVLNLDFTKGAWPSSLPLPASRGSVGTMIDANGNVAWGPHNLIPNSEVPSADFDESSDFAWSSEQSGGPVGTYYELEATGNLVGFFRGR